MADIPGIIEDAHEGKGLGIQFLRHIERNNILLFMVAANSDIEGEYRALLHELEEYRPDLLDKPRILALTKMDLFPDYKLEEPFEGVEDVDVIEISSATGYQIEQLKEKIWEKLEAINHDETS